MGGLPAALINSRRCARAATAWAAYGNPLAILGLAVVEFAAISSLLFFPHHVADAPLMLFVLPIALCAGRFELRGGLLSGAVALALVVSADVLTDLVLGPIGYLARIAAFLLLGALLGYSVREHQRLENQLNRDQELSLDMHCTAGVDGYFKRLNPAWERTLGFQATELMSRPFVEFIHPDDRAKTAVETAKLADGNLTVNFRNRYRTSEGSYRWLEWNARADSSEEVIYATARDVSEQKRAEEALEYHSELLERAVRSRTRDLAEARVETLQRLALAAEYRDDDTSQHTERVGHTSALIAAQLGLPQPEVELIRLAAPLHDIGKLAISDTILLKPGKLTTDEFLIMQEHVLVGAKLLSGSTSDVLKLGEEIARTHHERWDGTGYVARLSGEAIPISGRIVAVADVFDALTHSRPYKAAWSVEEAVAEIARLSGRQFDPRVVESFAALDHKRLLSRPQIARHLAVVA